MENTNETYKAKVYCSNCDFKGEIGIPKGQTIKQTECPTCGTPNVEKDFNAVLGGDIQQDYI